MSICLSSFNFFELFPRGCRIFFCLIQPFYTCIYIYRLWAFQKWPQNCAIACIFKKKLWLFKNYWNFKICPIYFTRFFQGKMVASSKGKRPSARTNLRVLWEMDYISAVTYTVWMVLIPKERACSKLHDSYKTNIQLSVLLPL